MVPPWRRSRVSRTDEGAAQGDGPPPRGVARCLGMDQPKLTLMASGRVLTKDWVRTVFLLSVWPVTARPEERTPLAYAPARSCPFSTSCAPFGPDMLTTPVVGFRPEAAGQLMTNVPASLLTVLLAAGEESCAKNVPVPACAPFWPEQPAMVPWMTAVTAPGLAFRPGV